MVQSNDLSRSLKPKTYTDFAYGNDKVFNNLMRWLTIDRSNFYVEYKFNVSVGQWDVDSAFDVPPYAEEYKGNKQAMQVFFFFFCLAD